MSDTIELSTPPGKLRKFYKITGSVINFELKTNDCALVGLSEKPGHNCDIWVALCEEMCWIKHLDNYCIQKSLPDMLSSDEFRSFNITVYNNCISLYKGSHQIITYRDDMRPPKYFTLGALRGMEDPIYWKIQVPISARRPGLRAIGNNGELHWVPNDNGKPAGAVIGGFENDILYIMRAEHEGSLTPGTYLPSLNQGFIPWGGNAIKKENCEVLCGYNCVWVKATCDELPAGAVEAGYSEENNETLYVGRVLTQQSINPGKIQPSHKACYYAYRDKEVASDTFEVLVDPNKHLYCYKKMFYSELIPYDPPPNVVGRALLPHQMDYYSSEDEE